MRQEARLSSLRGSSLSRGGGRTPSEGKHGKGRLTVLGDLRTTTHQPRRVWNPSTLDHWTWKLGRRDKHTNYSGKEQVTEFV